MVARPRLTAAATLVLGALAAWYAANNLGVNTDTANMIAPTIPWRQHYNEFRDAFPLRDRNLLIVVDAVSSARADEFAAELIAELRKRPELYRAPLLAGEGEFFERNGLLYLPTSELEELTDRLAAAQPLLGLLGTVSGMIRSFTAITADGVPNPVVLASGISEALVATAAGLTVAIPSLIAYRYLRGRVDALVVRIEKESMRFIEALLHHQRTGGTGVFGAIDEAAKPFKRRA